MPSARQPDFAAETRTWLAAYYALLKVVSLDRQNASAVEKAAAFLTWSRTDAFFSATATTFALIYLSPRRPPKMIKRVNSPNAAHVKEGLQNAAWDLLYLKHWLQQVSQSASNAIWFLFSNDQVLKRLARVLVEPDGDVRGQTLLQILDEYWGNESQALAEHYQAEKAAIMTADRKEVVDGRYAAMADGVANLERELGL